uniref:Solute carrier family 15 member 2 n=1 Tax=Nothobranchius furzeri TaxID=105023 RepID=A0A8C6LLM3_NOTFU
MAKKLCGTNYPLSICFIVVNEFCERFSYYGMKAVLTLYFLSYLKWDKDLSTAVYHAFSGLCYFTPILGALIADSWLGKFKTIIYLSIVYVIGHVIKSVGAIPTVGNKDVHIALSMLGLILIAFGTGGIKPCVAAFGGDQFDEDSMKERQKFFSIFYMSINAGSLLSTVITPVLRGDVKCFGEDCYALAFGVPAALMMVALAVFIFGSSLYKKNPPQGNILLQVCNCIGFAIKNRWNSSKSAPKRTHWLDWAEDKYSKRLIEEIRMVLRVLVLYIPLPMFWALFDQQGSRWTLQATRMNLAFMLNALMILLFVPIFDLIIYPLVSLCRINIRPLRKMATGMIFAALAFGAATLVEVNVVKTVVEPAPAGKCLLQVYNLAGRDISVKVPDNDVFPDPIKDLQVDVSANAGSFQQKVVVMFKETWFEPRSLTLKRSNTDELALLTWMFLTDQVEDYIKKNEDGNPNIRFFNTRPEPVNLTVGREQFYVPSDYSMTPNKSVDRGEPETCDSLNLGLLDFGASYTFILLQESGTIVAKRMEDVEANNVHIAWQIPQYVLLTAGEVMFSITGLEFSYSQAPTNMKSVLQAGWLLTVAFGNVIVLIVAEGAGLEQWKEFLLFAGLLLGVCVIFSIMAYFYTNNDPEQLDKIFLEDSRWDEDEDDNMKKKNEEIQLNKAGKSTRL